MHAWPAPHSHDDFDETVFELDGVTTFTVGGRRTDLNPGEALFHTSPRDPRIQ